MSVTPMRARRGKVAPMPKAQVIEHLVQNQKNRRFAIVSQSRCDRAMDSFIARTLHYDPDATPAERKAKFREAASIRKAIEAGKPAKIDPKVALLIMTSRAGRDAWDEVRESAEHEMKQLAQTLPVHEFVQSVRGFGDLGLAIVIAETGDLSLYPRPSHVWKRLGLAVIAGERQQRKTNPDEAALHGYNPKRRAEMWTLFSDSLFRAQWCGEDRAIREALEATPKAVAALAKRKLDLKKLKDDDLKAFADEFGITAAAGPTGPYGEVYARRRAITTARGLTPPGRVHNDARRIMTKAVLCDLWRVWHGQQPRYAKIEDDRMEAA